MLRGTLIVAINGKKIGSVEQFDKLLQSALDDPEISLEISNGEGRKIINVKPIKKPDDYTSYENPNWLVSQSILRMLARSSAIHCTSG